ncbi:MAG TPA: ferritin-like domain-containing protein [Solirubrobacteraceae bacterium]|jgi:rubrerythrin|nr:ferritin-like domain-containing protein [Solirubrobacteraceae bacterium]
MPAPTSEDSLRTTSEDELAPQPAGIVERLVRDDHDRKRFLKMVGGASAASFGAFVLAACGSSKSTSTGTAATATTSTGTTTTAATNPFGAGDIGILNYALTLEYLETEFYKKVVAAKMFSGKVGALLEEFSKQEQAHVIALTAAIKGAGGKTAAKPTGVFPINNPTQVAMLAYTVENLGASAYLGQAANIESKQVLAAALAIHSIEARHAATLGTLVSKSVTPNGAFAVPAEIPTVLAAVKPFLG